MRHLMTYLTKYKIKENYNPKYYPEVVNNTKKGFEIYHFSD